MIAFSVLSPDLDQARTRADAPAFLTDLNLDQIIDYVTSAKAEYELKPFFYRPLTRVDDVVYRHEVMRDLEQAPIRAAIDAFAQGLHDMRGQLAQSAKLYYPLQQQEWFLRAVEGYCRTVRTLAQDLPGLEPASRGLLALEAYLTDYVAGSDFQGLASETAVARAGLEAIEYSVVIRGDTFTVHPRQEEGDYSATIASTFEKFRQGDARNYAVKFRDTAEMNSVEAQVLEFVAKLFPQEFARLADLCTQRSGFLDETLAVFDREVQFYIAYLDYMQPFRQKGLAFCYPDVSDTSKAIFAQDTYDLALARKLLDVGRTTVCNAFRLEGQERIFIVSGPNQGGKTTFARTFGQLHYLASLGCQVAGSSARLFLFDRLCTHFEREEDIRNLRGKLEDDLVRIHGILQEATPRSVIIMNEIFTSTTLQDALFLGERIMRRIVELDLLCVCVTFIDELARLSDTTVSMVSTVVPEDPAQRTYKVMRRPADGRSYALSIAEKYQLDPQSLERRLAS